MITEKSLSLFACFTHDYIKEINTAYPIITYDSGAKLEINNKTFKLTTKNEVSHEFEYRDGLCVALEAQDEDVYITLHNLIEDNIYENVFNVMIYERYP
ncbi:MAG: hypothetical protein WC248_05535 [Candidatus Methanomethylophilaceae archaeon]|jgi:hypothetical protein